jgi:hypothetical protein
MAMHRVPLHSERRVEMSSQEEQGPQPPAPIQVELQGRWAGVEEIPVVLANQMLAQTFQGGALVTFGQATPPALLGTPDEQAAQARALGTIAIRPLARFLVPTGPLLEMAQALRTTADALEAEARQAADAAAGDQESTSE